MIRFVDVSKNYANKKTLTTVLDNINLTINKGEIVRIIGHSGAGKSTLLRLINGLIEPSSGNIFFNDFSMLTEKSKSLNRMRHSIGMIFQHFNLINSYTVYKNVLLNLKITNYPKDKQHQRVLEVLDLVGLNGKEHRYPMSLSGGEKQRLGIARAISNDPQILLCDEITSSLDTKTSNEIINLLLKIHEKTNITIVFISHQIEIIKDLVDRVIVLSKVKIVEDNLTKLIFTKPKHPETKSLISGVVYNPSFGQKEVYELIYPTNVDDTLISSIIKKYHVDVNILYGKTLTLKT